MRNDAWLKSTLSVVVGGGMIIFVGYAMIYQHDGGPWSLAILAIGLRLRLLVNWLLSLLAIGVAIAFVYLNLSKTRWREWWRNCLVQATQSAISWDY